MARSRRAGLPEYNFVGKGDCRDCRDEAMKVPRWFKTKAFSTISGCRDLCTNLSSACVGYAFGVSGYNAGCYVYGSMLPDQDTFPRQLLDGSSFSSSGSGGSDTLTCVQAIKGFECHAKKPGASSMHPLMSSPHQPQVPSGQVLSPCRTPHRVLAR